MHLSFVSTLTFSPQEAKKRWLLFMLLFFIKGSRIYASLFSLKHTLKVTEFWFSNAFRPSNFNFANRNVPFYNISSPRLSISHLQQAWPALVMFDNRQREWESEWRNKDLATRLSGGNRLRLQSLSFPYVNEAFRQSPFANPITLNSLIQGDGGSTKHSLVACQLDISLKGKRFETVRWLLF